MTDRARSAVVALGSNVGDREGHLAAAREALGRLPSTCIRAASSVEETPPLGGLRQPSYLNQMVLLETALSADALLDALHAIEASRGRVRRDRWEPRTLDLDIVLMEGESRADERLVIPHPGLADREFWQRELAELAAVAPVPSAGAPSPGWPAPAVPVSLPEWAIVTASRRAHVARVTALLEGWADAIGLEPDERAAWLDAGRLHDALRDADEATLRALVPGLDCPLSMLHGPAAAARLAADGERRASVLEAIRHHTVGSPAWDRTGRALYLADYLEPGRPFARERRAALAARVPGEFDAVFREVVRDRIEWALREGKRLYPECVALWNAVR